MTAVRLTFFSLIVFLTHSFVFAQEEVAEPEIEKHKLGNYSIEAKGANASLYLRAANDYGSKPKPELIQAVRSGSLAWIAQKDKELSYKVSVPETYQAGDPHGVIVFISSTPQGNSPFGKLLSEYNLISIAANNSGNKTDTLMRHTYAVQAVELLAQRYDLDPDRVYVSGSSGGGRVCSQVMMMNSDLFTGGLPFSGANPCLPMKTASSDGTVYQAPGMWPKPNRQLLSKAAKMNRYAFMTGDKDYNQKSVKLVSEGYQKAGFASVLYLEQPGHKHGRPSDEYFRKAFDFLDAPLVQAAQMNFETAQKKMVGGKLGQALPLFQKAAMHGKDADWVSEAKEKATELNEQYQAALADAESAIESLDKAEFKKTSAVLSKTWSIASGEVKAMKKRFAAAVKASKAK